MKHHDPEHATGALVEAFVGVLEQRVGDRVPELRASIEAEAAAIAETHQALVVDEPARHNMRMIAPVLAAYRVLDGTVPRAELLALLEEAFTGPFAGVVREGTARWLDGEADPFRAMVDLCQAKERDAYGAGFTFEHERDDDGAYLVNVRRCFYHDVFTAGGAPELTPVLCAFDHNWIEGIDPERHRFRFERPTTIGHGGPMCPFHFRRVEGGDR
jgi:L-2-amino-thiazoline-4-carboxylic acid hydrolase-like protein